MRWILLAGLVLTAGCNSPTEGERAFSLSIRKLEQLTEQSDTVIVGIGGLNVAGVVNIGCAGGLMSGRLERPASRELVLVTFADWPEGECEQPGASFSYNAIINLLASGQWHLQVLHTSDSQNAPPRTVFDDFVTVP